MERIRADRSFLSVFFSMVTALSLAACGGGGGGSSTGDPGPSSTTTISGKVTLSSTVTAKPTMMASMINKARLKQSGKANKVAGEADVALLKALSATTLSAPAALTSATIELYDADRPDWLSPVGIALSDPTGSYTLSTLQNAASNLNADGTAAYKDGDPVPAGNYTVIASKYDTGYGKLFVAVQAVVKKFSGAVPGNDLVAQDSSAVPTVSSMLGVSKNADGTFGSSTTLVPVNAKIQVTFSMAMARQSVVDGMKIVAADGTVVSGKWKVSPDLTAVTFSPDAQLTPNTVYTITVGGGKSLKKANNVYGKPLAADVKGTFKASAKDNTPPSVVRNSPTSAIANSMPITTPIRIGADEEIDITSLTITSTPSIGDKPAVKFVGKSTATADANYPYVYEIVPSEYLALGTTYAIGVSGGLDMAGNAMVGSTAVNFTTEATSAGVTGAAGSTDAAAQLGAKDVLGKWVSALNARNTSLLASYMSGDFFWINGGMGSPDDLNRDGRLDLNEFTSMLNTFFKQLDACGSTVAGDVDATNANVPGGIAVNGATTVLAFNLLVTPTNTADPTCAQSGPKNTLYAVMENINQAWLMTRGSDMYVASYPAALSKIALDTPANGHQFSEPVAGQPVTPEFKWSAAADAAGNPMSTYIVVLVDNNSRYLETGWVALVDGTSVAAGTPISAKFSGMPGDYGNMLVTDTGGNGNGPLGFSKMITEIKAGGSYSWAVIGFSTKKLADFKNITFDPAQFLAGSSANNGFTVGGVWKELKVAVVGAAGAPYTYSDSMGGYNVGTENSVTLTITTPNATTSGWLNVDGYTRMSQSLTFAPVNGVNTATVTIPLSNKRNWVMIDDYAGLTSEFNVLTAGGAMPKINVTAVSGFDCAGNPVTLGVQDAWGNYSNANVCKVDISGTVDPTLANTTLSLNLWNNDGNGQYYAQVLAGATGSFSLMGVPVYKGFNWISLGDSMWVNTYGFGVDTLAGSTYVPPIMADVAPATKVAGDLWSSSWDAGSVASVNLTVTMAKNTGMGNYTIVDPTGAPVGGGQITGTTATPITVPLNTGWNGISLWDGSNSYYVFIYTTGGTVVVPQNAITSITDGTTLLTTTPSFGYYQYPAGGASTPACNVTIAGTTQNAGNVNVYLNWYDSVTFASVYEYQTVAPVFNGTTYDYTINQPIYKGSNNIDISDGMGNWQGVQVKSTCATVPVVFGVSSVKDGATTLVADIYGTYNAVGASLTVTGTAKANATVTAYVNGLYSGTVSTTAGAGNTYTLSLPIYTGYNSISLTDGFNWVYLNANTVNGATYTTPINSVVVSGSTLSSGGASSENWSSWNTSLGTVDISGKTAVNGTGNYNVYNSSWAFAGSGTFTVAGGAFTLPGVALSYGYNYVELWDANGNYYSVQIYTSGGAGAPAKLVSITGPVQNATASGAVTVTGTVNVANFAAAHVRGYVYDYMTGISTYYSSNSADWAYGDQPLTYDTVTGAFSFNASVTAGNTTVIEAYAIDANWTVSHGNGIYVNNTLGYGDYFYKPGTKASAANSKAKAHKTEFVKRMTKH